MCVSVYVSRVLGTCPAARTQSRGRLSGCASYLTKETEYGMVYRDLLRS
jgi:hypothetical protein